MMRAELDADAETIDSLWNLPGFVTRTEDVSRRRVVSEENFAKKYLSFLFVTPAERVSYRMRQNQGKMVKSGDIYTE